jgi:hypothetical protein
MKVRHKKYEFVMTRTYETTIGIMAENERDATEIYNKLGDYIYDIELDQCNVISEDVVLKEQEEEMQMKDSDGNILSIGDEVVLLSTTFLLLAHEHKKGDVLRVFGFAYDDGCAAVENLRTNDFDEIESDRLLKLFKK